MGWKSSRERDKLGHRSYSHRNRERTEYHRDFDRRDRGRDKRRSRSPSRSPRYSRRCSSHRREGRWDERTRRNSPTLNTDHHQSGSSEKLPEEGELLPDPPQNPLPSPLDSAQLAVNKEQIPIQGAIQTPPQTRTVPLKPAHHSNNQDNDIDVEMEVESDEGRPGEGVAGRVDSVSGNKQDKATSQTDCYQTDRTGQGERSRSRDPRAAYMRNQGNNDARNKGSVGYSTIARRGGGQTKRNSNTQYDNVGYTTQEWSQQQQGYSNNCNDMYYSGHGNVQGSTSAIPPPAPPSHPPPLPKDPAVKNQYDNAIVPPPPPPLPPGEPPMPVAPSTADQHGYSSQSAYGMQNWYGQDGSYQQYSDYRQYEQGQGEGQGYYNQSGDAGWSRGYTGQGNVDYGQGSDYRQGGGFGYNNYGYGYGYDAHQAQQYGGHESTGWGGPGHQQGGLSQTAYNDDPESDFGTRMYPYDRFSHEKFKTIERGLHKVADTMGLILSNAKSKKVQAAEHMLWTVCHENDTNYHLSSSDDEWEDELDEDDENVWKGLTNRMQQEASNDLKRLMENNKRIRKLGRSRGYAIRRFPFVPANPEKEINYLLPNESLLPPPNTTTAIIPLNGTSEQPADPRRARNSGNGVNENSTGQLALVLPEQMQMKIPERAMMKYIRDHHKQMRREKEQLSQGYGPRATQQGSHREQAEGSNKFFYVTTKATLSTSTYSLRRIADISKNVFNGKQRHCYPNSLAIRKEDNLWLHLRDEPYKQEELEEKRRIGYPLKLSTPLDLYQAGRSWEEAMENSFISHHSGIRLELYLNSGSDKEENPVLVKLVIDKLTDYGGLEIGALIEDESVMRPKMPIGFGLGDKKLDFGEMGALELPNVPLAFNNPLWKKVLVQPLIAKQHQKKNKEDNSKSGDPLKHPQKSAGTAKGIGEFGKKVLEASRKVKNIEGVRKSHQKPRVGQRKGQSDSQSPRAVQQQKPGSVSMSVRDTGTAQRQSESSQALGVKSKGVAKKVNRLMKTGECKNGAGRQPRESPRKVNAKSKSLSCGGTPQRGVQQSKDAKEKVRSQNQGECSKRPSQLSKGIKDVKQKGRVRRDSEPSTVLCLKSKGVAKKVTGQGKSAKGNASARMPLSQTPKAAKGKGRSQNSTAPSLSAADIVKDVLAKHGLQDKGRCSDRAGRLSKDAKQKGGVKVQGEALRKPIEPAKKSVGNGRSWRSVVLDRPSQAPGPPPKGKDRSCGQGRSPRKSVQASKDGETGGPFSRPAQAPAGKDKSPKKSVQLSKDVKSGLMNQDRAIQRAVQSTPGRDKWLSRRGLTRKPGQCSKEDMTDGGRSVSKGTSSGMAIELSRANRGRSISHGRASGKHPKSSRPTSRSQNRGEASHRSVQKSQESQDLKETDRDCSRGAPSTRHPESSKGNRQQSCNHGQPSSKQIEGATGNARSHSRIGSRKKESRSTKRSSTRSRSRGKPSGNPVKLSRPNDRSQGRRESSQTAARHSKHSKEKASTKKPVQSFNPADVDRTTWNGFLTGLALDVKAEHETLERQPKGVLPAKLKEFMVDQLTKFKQPIQDKHGMHKARTSTARQTAVHRNLEGDRTAGSSSRVSRSNEVFFKMAQARHGFNMPAHKGKIPESCGDAGEMPPPPPPLPPPPVDHTHYSNVSQEAGRKRKQHAEAKDQEEIPCFEPSPKKSRNWEGECGVSSETGGGGRTSLLDHPVQVDMSPAVQHRARIAGLVGREVIGKFRNGGVQGVVSSAVRTMLWDDEFRDWAVRYKRYRKLKPKPKVDVTRVLPRAVPTNLAVPSVPSWDRDGFPVPPPRPPQQPKAPVSQTRAPAAPGMQGGRGRGQSLGVRGGGVRKPGRSGGRGGSDARKPASGADIMSWISSVTGQNLK